MQRFAADGDGGRAEAGVAFFAAATSGRALLRAEEVAEAVAAYGSVVAGWRADLAAETGRLLDEGLPVYAATQAGPLRHGLDWSALPQDSHGDRLYPLRPHRFGFLPRLAIAACCGEETMPALRATLENWTRWVAANAGRGDAYFSNLVVIYRVLATTLAAPFCVARARQGDAAAAAVCLRLMQILAADVRFLVPRLGHSVANNHLLADRFAGWLIAACYPDLWPEADLTRLDIEWQVELHRQFRPDGTNFEQSVHYHEIGCEMALVYLAISLRGGSPLSARALELVEQMLRFQATLAGRAGGVFALGDTTEDPLLPLDAGGGAAGGAWRVLYKSLFCPAFPPTPDTAQGAERAFWLSASLQAVEKPLRPSPVATGHADWAVFPDNGYVVLGERDEAEKVLFRTGPRPGVAISPGHAMSDLLSVYWSVADQAVLEPAGTYSYAAEAPPPSGGPRHPRNYLRSSAAHNCLVLPGHDPLGVPAERFRGPDNGTRVESRLRALPESLGWAEAELLDEGPLRGYRRGVLRVAGRCLLVYDRLPAEESVPAVHWQFAPEAAVTLDDAGRASARFAEFSVFCVPAGGVAGAKVATGRADPPAGWVSRRYGALAPAPQLHYALKTGAAVAAFAFGIAGEGDALPSLEVLGQSAEGIVLALRQGGEAGVACIGAFEGDLPGLGQRLAFRGDALWLDFQGQSCYEVRALGVQQLRFDGLAVEGGVQQGEASAGSAWRCRSKQTGPQGLSAVWSRSAG